MTRAINNIRDKTEIWPPRESTNIKRNQLQTFDFPCKYIVAKKPIGEGSYSTVYECKNIETSIHYAAKRYTKKLVFGLEDMLQNEFQVLKSSSMSHRNLLNLVDYFETERYIFLVTDLAHGGELFDRIVGHPDKKLPEKEVIEITRQLVDAVQYLHSMNIVHRDIKAENILFQSNRKNDILLADFGLARIIKENTHMLDIAGTLSYMAPEMLAREEYRFSVDMWAIGVTVYFMLCGYMPFDCETDDETKEAIGKGDYMFEPHEYWTDISDNAKDFLRKCFVVNPDKRMLLSQAKLHPFLLSNSRPSSSREPTLVSLSRLSTSLDMLQTLRQQLVNAGLDSTKDATRVKSFLELSRLSTTTDTPLYGALCRSPSTKSVFTTPLTSTSISRIGSADVLHTDAKRLDYTGRQNKSTFFI